MTDLRSILAPRLAAEAVPASEVMALALYHTELGYYRQAAGPWGLEGKDYYTALDSGPLLGATLALRLEAAWERLGRPGAFTVLEPGAGRGWLGRDLLASAREPFASALRYLHQDDSPAGRREAQDALAPWLGSGRARLVPEGDVVPPFVGAIVSNELFDALPAQPWRWTGEVWEREVLASEGPAWEAGDPGEAGAWFAAQAEGGLEPGDGSVWCEGLPGLVTSLASSLEAGLFLAFDYGEAAPRLLAKGADLRRFRGHQVDGRWWEDLGRADLTADVDLTRLGHLLEAGGLRGVQVTSLGRWVRTHAPLADWEAEWQGLEAPQRLKRMENLLALTLPGMMGDRFKTVEAWRD